MFHKHLLLVAIGVAQALAAPPATVQDLVSAGKRPGTSACAFAAARWLTQRAHWAAMPDFARYIDTRTLNHTELGLGQSSR